MITNFEVEEPKDQVEVRNGVKIFGTGIRGLRALRQNREDEEEEEKERREDIELKGDRFKRFN